jgi:excisionase family DNA binding protein
MHGETCIEETMRTPSPITLPARLRADAPGSPEPFGFDERLYSAQEVASRLGVSERWVRDHATRRSPRIRAVKLGPLVRFRWPDVQAFLAELAARNDSKCR